MLVAGCAVLPLLGAPPSADRGASALQILPPATRAFLFVYTIAVLGASSVYFWTRHRRALGMKPWRLRLETRGWKGWGGGQVGESGGGRGVDAASVASHNAQKCPAIHPTATSSH